MTAATAYQTIFKFIAKERAMREYVFKNQPAKRADKLAECDETLTALEWLRQAASVPAADVSEPYRQDSLL